MMQIKINFYRKSFIYVILQVADSLFLSKILIVINLIQISTKIYIKRAIQEHYELKKFFNMYGHLLANVVGKLQLYINIRYSAFIFSIVISQKSAKATQELQALEKIWLTWLNQQMQTAQPSEEPQKKVDLNEQESSKLIEAQDKSLKLQKYFKKLRERVIDNKMYLYMTNCQIQQFFDDASIQLHNKIKLYEDIQKLKLLSTYPTNCKRTYSKQANVILKKWLMENYSNPYPSNSEIEKMVEQTNLTQKQVIITYINSKILNWFINARNSLKNKLNPEKKFKSVVEQKFKELQKKLKIEY
ncbi:homeodomain mating type protein alpha2 [Paramecium bursaria]